MLLALLALQVLLYRIMMLDKKKLLLSQFLPVIRENVMGSQIIEETNCLSLSSIVKVITSQQRQFEKSVEVGR